MDIIEQPQSAKTAARLEGRILAAAFLLVGIGFWQHYTNYMEAEQRGALVASAQTAAGSASGGAIAARR